jgi:hypothetical protein
VGNLREERHAERDLHLDVGQAGGGYQQSEGLASPVGNVLRQSDPKFR